MAVWTFLLSISIILTNRSVARGGDVCMPGPVGNATLCSHNSELLVWGCFSGKRRFKLHMLDERGGLTAQRCKASEVMTAV